jgi:FkbH-like protein
MYGKITEERRMAWTKSKTQSINCVVWDLDDTVWDGILLQDGNVSLRDGVRETLQELDRRGILNSIASKNDYNVAMEKLETFGLDEYFLYPEINWNSKSISLQNIAKSLNTSLDNLAFINSRLLERQEVSFVYPEVLCIDVADLPGLMDLPCLIPRFVTPESRLRRQMYQKNVQRDKAEAEFPGSKEEFLATLDMVFEIRPAQECDLERAVELAVRTHQHNTTGYIYSCNELDELRRSRNHLLLLAGMNDKYGAYGIIGLALVALGKEVWIVQLLLMSRRVASRGVGSIMMSHVMLRAKEANVRLRAHFVPNGRNRKMYVDCRFGGFREVKKEGDLIILENDLEQIQPWPDYVRVHVVE